MVENTPNDSVIVEGLKWVSRVTMQPWDQTRTKTLRLRECGNAVSKEEQR